MAKKQNIKTSIIVPAYNEEKNIIILLEQIKKECPEHELVVVADGSTDRTLEISEKYADQVLHKKKKKGKGAALWHGFMKAKGDILIMIDADLSHHPRNVNQMVDIVKNDPNTGMVIGSRRKGGSEDYTFLRDIGNSFLTTIGNLILNVKLTDMLNGFKVFRKDILKSNEGLVNGFGVEIELIGCALKHNYKIVEIPDKEYARAHGKSNLHSFRDGFKILFQIIAERKKIILHKKIRRRERIKRE